MFGNKVLSISGSKKENLIARLRDVAYAKKFDNYQIII
jgi:hypothetical protein